MSERRKESFKKSIDPNKRKEQQRKQLDDLRIERRNTSISAKRIRSNNDHTESIGKSGNDIQIPTLTIEEAISVVKVRFVIHNI